MLRRSGGLKGATGEGVGRDQGFVGSGLLNEPTSSGDAHVGAKACGPLFWFHEPVLAYEVELLAELERPSLYREADS